MVNRGLKRIMNFFYNTAVNNVTNVNITNVYDARVFHAEFLIACGWGLVTKSSLRCH